MGKLCVAQSRISEHGADIINVCLENGILYSESSGT